MMNFLLLEWITKRVTRQMTERIKTFDDAVDSLQKQEKLYQGSSTVGRERLILLLLGAQSTRGFQL